MHELAIAEDIVSTVLECAGGRDVSVVRVKVGLLAGVVPDALTFCFEVATAGTVLESTVLDLEMQRGSAHCRTCDHDFALPGVSMLCACGSADVVLLTGRELMVKSVEVV